jgi:hypothetical protein
LIKKINEFSANNLKTFGPRTVNALKFQVKFLKKHWQIKILRINGNSRKLSNKHIFSIGKIWLILCPFRTPYALNLLNCVIAALSNLALYHFLSIGTKSEISALIGSLWFAFSNNVWEYSSQFENFALNNLLVITILYTYYSYLENVSRKKLPLVLQLKIENFI